MAERLRTTAATVEAGNAATVTALADLRAELAEVKASLQDFVQGGVSLLLRGRGCYRKAGILSCRRGGEAQAVARMEEERLVAKASLDKVSKMLRAAK